MSNFDAIQEAAFSTVHNVYGDVALWTSNNNLSGDVLVNAKNEKETIDTGIGYEGAQYVLEYYEGTFPGLYEKVKKGKTTEYFTVNGINLVNMPQAIEKMWDGKTYKIYCIIK